MIDDRVTENIQRFFSTISPWEAAYTDPGLSYLAIRKDGVLNLLRGRLFLNTVPSKIPRAQFQTSDVLVGYFPLSELGQSHRDIVSQLAATGRMTTPVGELVLPVDDQHPLTSHFVPFHQEGLRAGNRLPVLTFFGTRLDSYVQQPHIDWELKAAPQPFDTLDELLLEYFLGGSRDERASIEIIAANVVAINLSSRVDGEEAAPSVYLAKSLDQNKCNIGYRVFLQGNVVSRGSISGSTLDWSEQDTSRLDAGKLKIPLGAALHCVASYDGFAIHLGWIADPKNFPNARRASLEEFDDKLEILRDYLFEEPKAKTGARDFEFGVAWLMWMLGFSVAQAGGTSRTGDAPDIIATTPKGNIAIVECTIGLLKAENKLAKLVDRTELVRKRIASSGHSHLKLLPVIVTAKTKDEVGADLEQAQKLGVAVVTKEDLTAALNRTIIVVDADVFFEQALESVKPQQEQPGLLPT
jgi:hypothetical protein